MPDQYTQIPLVAKLTKILLREWANASYGGGPSSRARTPDTDDEDGEWDDEPGQSKMDEMAFLSGMLITLLHFGSLTRTLTHFHSGDNHRYARSWWT